MPRRGLLERRAKAKKQEPKGLDHFLKKECIEFFRLFRKTVDVNNSDNFIDIDKEKIRLNDVINFEYIKANRDVSNKEPDKTLSSLSAKI